ncbi:hypothetical protein L3V82_04380 [Thiotrichales bacterium 19S3-7]|nr:hypothetical protein [Thiotrichales bacterium 19S3-7]MCF6801331.1 hypothetical protein [Thiotrichales bacterium 19S3-11]
MNIMKSLTVLTVSSTVLMGCVFAEDINLTIINNLENPQQNNQKPCMAWADGGGNSATIFTPKSDQVLVLPTGKSGEKIISGDFSIGSGLGIQINNWYWLIGDNSTKYPVGKASAQNPQNPDNSGAQFYINASCQLTNKVPAWSGKGIETYLIADIAVTGSSGNCTLTISKNSYTNAVTPSCCAPFGDTICKESQRGITDTGQSWPPK